MKKFVLALTMCFAVLFAGALFVGCSDENLKYNITVVSDHGQVAVGKEQAKAGEEIHIVCEADEGYALKSITVNGVEVPERNFFMPNEDANIVAIFERLYTISIVNHAQGSIVLSKNKAVEGETVVLSASANNGYRFMGFFQTTKNDEDENDVTNVWRSGCNSFVQGKGETSISPIFEAVSNIYNISVLNSYNGVVEVEYQSATAGSKIEVSCTANTGYAVKKIKINDMEIVGNTFIMPSEDVSIYVEFARVYAVTVASAEHGEVVANKTNAFAGDVIVLTATPEDGYRLAGFVYKGVTYTGNTFEMLAEDVEVAPIFEEIA